MDWSPFLEKVGYFLIISSVAAVGWVAKTIIKPWSDAALKKGQAFTDLVEVLRTSVPAMHTELQTVKKAAEDSNIALGKNTDASNRQTESSNRLVAAFGSDPMKMCKASSKEELVEMFKLILSKNGVVLDDAEAAIIVKHREAIASKAKETDLAIPVVKR